MKVKSNRKIITKKHGKNKDSRIIKSDIKRKRT